MQEHDIRLLFEAGQIKAARIGLDEKSSGWNVRLVFQGDRAQELLHAKRGGRRVFRTSDAALAWCGEIGLKSVKVELGSKVVARRAVRAVGKNDTILLIEDNEDDIALTLRAFRNNNIQNEIVVKRDGQEALDYLFNTDAGADKLLPVLILLDINLPGINGLHILEKIRQNETTRLLPVVVLTSSNEPEYICQCYDLGTNSYLKKPANLSVFSNMISEIWKYWMGLNTSPPAMR